MKLSNLKPAKGSTRSRKRIARGQGSGRGGTSTRGHKGAKSRSGYKIKRNFEGGQMPIQMRLPKRGFKNPNRVTYVPINLDRLQDISEKYNVTDITVEALVENGIVRKNDRVKVLANGELDAALKVTVHACSESAKQAIEAKGGSVNLV
jgi:large subunit ribosomal protein L15